MATVTSFQTSAKSTQTGQQRLRSPTDQTSNQMDARRMWLPHKIYMAQSHQSRQLCGLANANERNIQKYYPKTIEMAKGHLNQTRKNVRSTKAKTAPLETCNTSQLNGKKLRDVYTKTYRVRKTMFSDQTGRFPTRSQQGNKYIMVMVEIDSNTILVEPMKSRKDEEMIRAYNALLLRLRRAGIVPKKHILDNKVSENMKNHIWDT